MSATWYEFISVVQTHFIQYFKSQLLGYNILAFTFNFCIDFIEINLSFFVFVIIYAIIVIAYLVINLLMPYVDVYTICIKKLIDRKCLQRLRGNNKSETRYKILRCKVCFLARKDKQRDREPSPFGPFYWPKWHIFLTFHILLPVKSLLFCIPEA